MGLGSPVKKSGEMEKVPTIVAQVSQATKRARAEAEKALAQFKVARGKRKAPDSPKKSPTGRQAKSARASAQGLEVPEAESATGFMVNWFKKASRGVPGGSPGLRLCSHEHCGRVETRRHEFRRCSACGSVNYCSTGENSDPG